MKFKAVLWDCDGCLIDSEMIACAHAAQLLTQAGYPISTQDFVTRFAGQHKEHIYSTIEQESGLSLYQSINTDANRAQQKELFRTHLQAIPGIFEALQVMGLPVAIASGSDFERLHFTLDLTKLSGYFGKHIYSASLVKNGKPAPDIFLYAAEKLGVAPQDCLVIEDSLNGVKSGKAAGMTVFGFTGGSHVPDKALHEKLLLKAGADLVFHHMYELPGLTQTYVLAA